MIYPCIICMMKIISCCQFYSLSHHTILLISQLCQYCHEGPCKSSGHCCFPIYFHNVWLDRCPFPSWLNLEAIFTLGTLYVYALTSLSLLNSTHDILVNRWETIQSDALMILELSLDCDFRKLLNLTAWSCYMKQGWLLIDHVSVAITWAHFY